MKDISDFVIESGWLSLIYGYKYSFGGFHLHHVLGRSAKHNKVSIGHWFIIPVPVELHDVASNHELNVTHHKHAFTDRYGKQKTIFLKLCSAMVVNGYDMPPDNVLDSIGDTNA